MRFILDVNLTATILCSREVGLLTLYLASGASAYITGPTLYLDGGLTL